MADYRLFASREKGSIRQLWSEDETAKPSIYELRPKATRSSQQLQKLLNTDECRSIIAALHQIPEHIPNSMNAEAFSERFQDDSSMVPLIVDNCDNGGSITPKTIWTLPNLVYILNKDRRLEVSQEDATVSVSEYMKYLDSLGCKDDDDPVLIFETLVDHEHDCIIDRYSIPQPFSSLSSGCHHQDDVCYLLSACGNDGLAYGLHRWMILGPMHSGSNLHVDPLGTSAWNMLLLGRKLWVLFPPDVNESDLKSLHQIQGNSNAKDFCAAGWFAHMLPRIQKENPKIYNSRIQFVQQAGETVFVPQGWWHTVLNLETTFAVTQNFGHLHSYPIVADALREADPDAFREWSINARHIWREHAYK